MIFLTTGEKIRSLRKKFDMRQQELEDENITRAFISMIETGKRGLSKETAKHIAESFNKKAESLGVAFNIDETYLLRTPAEDAEVYCLNKLNNNPTKDEIDVIIQITRKHSLTKVEAQAHKVLGDYDFEDKAYVKAFINYMMSLDLYKETEEKAYTSYLFNRLGECKANKFDYLEANSFFGRAYYYAMLYKDSKAEKEAIYNIAANFKKLEKYDEALEYTQRYLELCNKEKELKEYICASVLKANCYRYKQNKEKALKICMDAMAELSDKNNEAAWHLYSNIGLIYLEENDLDTSLEWLDKAEKAAENSCVFNLSLTYIQKSSIFIKNGSYEEGIKFANKGLKLALETSDILTTMKAYRKLIDGYSCIGDFTNLKSTYIKLLDVLKNKEAYKAEVVKIYNKLALLYLEQNDIEMCKKYLQMIS
ncbi:helix-turn-helix domain-containing protein [Clostridium swellfunianum]|uniref:helix-turn-helix domain-containing protein n=1 Tax=Clostridium swellfunianum TaxID=1367462 RepID=UPI00202EED40|nr:helix-turn-helix domain-containing protein [Clostridium swellfunianum]MCM0648237.1 helix-turn-helix domain-containing protein [Clostridium swellfunianum]